VLAVVYVLYGDLGATQVRLHLPASLDAVEPLP
jgi:hypothetical protein